jgi:hypothetical protein|tara:strand:- start:26171 stop:26386 length:216 start_codon:yes stop_codon:yes gene_type:complete
VARIAQLQMAANEDLIVRGPSSFHASRIHRERLRKRKAAEQRLYVASIENTLSGRVECIIQSKRHVSSFKP